MDGLIIPINFYYAVNALIGLHARWVACELCSERPDRVPVAGSRYSAVLFSSPESFSIQTQYCRKDQQ
jgi:hypothetical protein